MSIVVLDPDGRYAADCPNWLADSGRSLVLLTGRAGEYPGFSAVRVVRRYAESAAVETTVLDLARQGGVSAVVALDPADQIRAGGLRDHLGLAGQSRDTALALADGVAAQDLLARAGVPATRREEVRRVADLYWWAHQWGYPLAVRRRRAAGRPVGAELAELAELADEAALRAFVAGGFLPDDPSVVPSLTVEPLTTGERHHGPGLAVTDAVLAALPSDPGHPYAVEAVREAGGDWLVHGLGYHPAARPARALVRAQAGLDPELELKLDADADLELKLEPAEEGLR
ncbi:hypothetical protein [Kitasatospora sp. MAP5-34]|uniref:hypothetical protein n=1 Tax=Kitasatospora sp. MAP5-34 TaxID=3035102 RepID=UPI0024742A68|nr:hypothetical protein [Kitasatospora sp. MAP5-34]MDH6577346.1 hypothetical protein [Kitasatospora sp. MAP5-34]